jgi:membrane associated rhomboid family serine protease
VSVWRLRFTPLLAVFLGGLHLLKVHWGGDYIPLHLAMGAGHRGMIAAGEPWRFFSGWSAHGSVDHLLGNVVVLLICGGVVEFLLGWRRAAVLYLGAGTAAALASAALIQPNQWMGASGATFGLCGGSAWLLWRAPGALHPRIVVCLRIGVTLLLLLQLLGTLRFIRYDVRMDWAAHLGGLVAGVCLAALWTGPSRPKTRSLRLGAAVSCLCVFGAPIWAVLQGQPWLVLRSAERELWPQVRVVVPATTVIQSASAAPNPHSLLRAGTILVVEGQPTVEGDWAAWESARDALLARASEDHAVAQSPATSAGCRWLAVGPVGAASHHVLALPEVVLTVSVVTFGGPTPEKVNRMREELLAQLRGEGMPGCDR